jgi:hypothetical protein
LTLLDLARAREIAARVEILARRLADTIGGSGADKATILELFRRSQTDTDKPFVDVADLCLNLMRESGNPLVMKAANALGDLLITPAPARPGESQIGGGRPFVQEHGRNAAKTAKLNGISLYAPHVAAKLDFEPSRIPYGRFVFAQASLWNALVHNLAASV